MVRRAFLLLPALTALMLATEKGETVLRGQLVFPQGDRPQLKTEEGKLYTLEGDKKTTGVLHDERLQGTSLEIHGQLLAPDHLRVGPIHKNSMFVLKEGKKFTISYWCDVCSIRTYTPGVCMCCQRETDLDLQEYHQH